MTLDWLGKYREFVGEIYRSANAYSSVCKTETLGDNIRFTAYEVQIMEYIMEYEDEYHNMTWHARKMGLSTSTYSKYVNKLVKKGLLEKYRTSGNKKNIVLRVSDVGKEEYRKYSEHAEKTWFYELFQKLDEVPKEHLDTFTEIIKIWGGWHIRLVEKQEEIELLKL